MRRDANTSDRSRGGAWRKTMRWIALAVLAAAYACSASTPKPPQAQPVARSAPSSHTANGQAVPSTNASAQVDPNDAGQADAAADASADAPEIAIARSAADREQDLSVEEILALPATASTSLGSPGNGTLQGAVALPIDGPGFIHNPRRPRAARFGSVELVQALIRSAAQLQRTHPDSTLVVNDLSLESGGPIAQHGSHQNGRDVDLLFFLLDRRGRPMPSVGVPLDPTGHGVDFKDLAIASDDVPVRLDAKRTMRFIAALIEVSGDAIQRIFLVEHLRTLLLAEAERLRLPKRTRERFELLTCQPETPHDDHIHVRFFCAPDDIQAGCLDSSPMYPFRRAALRALGISPSIESPAARRDAKRKQGVAERTTSLAQARARAERSGPMHPRVRAFLDAREQWAQKPQTGRPHCR